MADDVDTDALIERIIYAALADRVMGAADPVYAERVKRQAELYKQMAISEPVTLRHELTKMHEEPGISPDFRERYLEPMSGIQFSMSEDFAFFAPAQDCFHFIRRVAQNLPAKFVHDILQKTLLMDWRISRAALLEATNLDESVGFERRTRILADVMRRAAEGWYKPFLTCALTMSYRSRSCTTAIVPDELEAAMAACHDSNDVPKTILLDTARIVRNATAHSGLEFQLSSSEVTFVNTRRNGQREVLGPLSWDGVKELADDLINLCWALTIVWQRQRRLLAGGAA